MVQKICTKTHTMIKSIKTSFEETIKMTTWWYKDFYRKLKDSRARVEKGYTEYAILESSTSSVPTSDTLLE